MNVDFYMCFCDKQGNCMFFKEKPHNLIHYM